MIEKRQQYRNKKILDAAKGQECTINSPVCNYDSSTVVFAHFNDGWAGKGAGQKADDFAGAFACSDCHKWLDGEIWKTDTNQNKILEQQLLVDYEFYWRRGMYWTIRRLLDLGILK